MAHKLYFDNVDTIGAALADGTMAISGDHDEVRTYSNASTLTNESYATDNILTTAITDWGDTDALRFNLGSAKAVNFAALYFTSAEDVTIEVHAHSAIIGVMSETKTQPSDFSAGWNIIHTTAEWTYKVWFVSAEGATIDNLTQIYLGTALELPIAGDGITIEKPYNSFVSSTYNNTEFSNKIDTELRKWSLQVPILPEADKTSLETLMSVHKNTRSFVYYDESSYHHVRLAKPLTFNQVATNAYSTTITLQEVA
tara:strand:+ start:541 stop:1305 length:765 start_codon:yes stop_codon:yes gene_type:complete